MKKILFLLCICVLVLTGCGKITSKDVISGFRDLLDKSKGYQLNGNLEVTSNDEVFQYDVVVDYMKDHYYKVSLVNEANQFQQIILKNDDGVFLMTPSLNKSFKFQSDWPYQNSQIYLIDALLHDIENDKDITFSEKDDQYVIETKVDYPNNTSLVRQKIELDKKYQLKKVTVYDNNDVVCMSFTVDKVTYSPNYDKDYFEIDSAVDDNQDLDEESVGVLEDIIYPLIIPAGTKLVDEEKVLKDRGERVIMTYDGEKSFLLVEETLDVFQEFTVIPSSGEPYPLMDTIGVVTDNSLSWSSGNREYYLVSDVMSREELVDIAQSIVGVSSFK